MNTLAGLHHGAGLRIGKLPHFVGEDTGGVDDYLGLCSELMSALAVQCDHPVYEAVLIFGDLDDSGIVEQCRIVIGSGSCKMMSSRVSSNWPS